MLGTRHLPVGTDIEQVHKEVVGQRLGPAGEDTECGLSGVGGQDTQAADENGHLGSGQCQQAGPIYQLLLGLPLVSGWM